MISFLIPLKKFYMHIFMSDLFIIFLDQFSDLYQLISIVHARNLKTNLLKWNQNGSIQSCIS